MKILKILLVIIYAIVYSYAVWMTSVEPQNPKWGWICTLIFGIAAIWGLSIFTKNNHKPDTDNLNNDKDGKQA